MTVRRVHSFVLLLVLTVLITPVHSAEELPRARPEAVGLSGPRLDRLTDAMQAYVDDGRLAGGVVIVARRGRVAYLESFGQRDRESNSPMTTDAIFRIASQTKAIISTGVMLLQEEGKLLISDPVGRYLPEFARTQVAVAREGGGYDVVPARGRITIRQLLTHTSGLRPGISLRDKWNGAQAAIGLACRETLRQQPGTKFTYSDINFILLGEIVRRISGKPLNEFAKDHIFTPLKMHDTGFLPATALTSRIAPTEAIAGKMLRGTVHDPTAHRMGGVAGHAGLFSTVDDVMRFGQAFLDAWHGRSDVLPQDTVRLFSTRQQLPDDSDWALGWDTPTAGGSSSGQYFSENSVGHLGFTGTSLWIDQEKNIIVVLLTNRVHPTRENSGMYTIRRKFHTEIMKAIL